MHLSKRPRQNERKKQPPTPAEMKKILTESIAELKGIVTELNEEKVRLQPLNLKRTNELMAETLQNLAEDLEDLELKLKELDLPQA